MSFKNFMQQKMAPVHGDYYIQKGQENPKEHKYDEIARDAYQYNAYFRACVELISNTAASLNPVLCNYTDNGDKEQLLVSDLWKLLMHPNPDEGAYSFKQRMFSYALVADECYIQLVTVGRDKTPRALNIIQPDKVKVISGGYSNPIGHFEVNSGKGIVKIPKSQMIYVKGFNPTKITAGSPLAYASGYAIDTNNEMMKYNLRNMQNGGVPPLVIKGARTQREVDGLSDMWDRTYGGSNNAGKPFFPMSGVEIEQLGMSNRDAQWLEGIELTGKQIMMAMNVAPEILLGTSNRASYEQAYKSLYIQAVLPLWQSFLDAMNNVLVPLFAKKGQHLMLEIDRNKIDALSEDKNELHKRERQDYLAGIATRKEAREVLGYNPEDSGADGDSFQRPVNVTVVPQDGEEIDPMDGDMEDVVGDNLADAEPNADDNAIADR